MRSGRASLIGAEAALDVAQSALSRLTEVRGRMDHPGLFPAADHPWTDHFARLTREAVEARLPDPADGADIHVVAARWRAASLLGPGRVRAGAHPLYDVAWRVYPADGGRLLAQNLIAECIWKGGWPALARAGDRLAQARSAVKLLIGAEDPARQVGAMSLAEACAFRISAFAPKGERVMLAFYGSGGEDSWRDVPGFTVFDYVTGEANIIQSA